MSVVVLNGELQLAVDALVPVGGALASFGEGALEVFRTTAHGPFLASRHLVRLKRACETLDIPATHLEQDFIEDLGVLSQQGKGPWRVRVLRSRTEGGVMRALLAEPFEVSKLLLAGARLTLREGVVTPLATKTTSYAASRVFRREAARAGFDECLLYFGDEVLEGASSNIALVKNGVLVSPTSPWILEGITLQRVMELAAELGIPTQRRAVNVSELEDADELFITSAIRGPIAVVQLDARSLQTGRVFAALRSRYDKDLKSDWGELHEESISGPRDSVERRLSSVGRVNGDQLCVGDETYVLRRSTTDTGLRVQTPCPGAGLRLRNLAIALRKDPL